MIDLYRLVSLMCLLGCLGASYRSGKSPLLLLPPRWGKWRHGIQSRAVKELLALLLSITCEPGCLLPEVGDPGWDCAGACFHNCIWRSVLLISGGKGWGSGVWGEGRTSWRLATGSMKHKTVSSGKMSNNWETAREEVERQKKWGDPGRNEGISYETALRLFPFLSVFFFHHLTCKG